MTKVIPMKKPIIISGIRAFIAGGCFVQATGKQTSTINNMNSDNEALMQDDIII